MFILLPVMERAVFFVLSKDSLFRCHHVCKFIIERLEPKSNWNFTVLLKILTITYLHKFSSSLSPGCVCLILFLGFLNFMAYQQRVTLWVTTDITWSWWWIFPSIRILFVVNIWSCNFTLLFLWGIECWFALDLFNMSNSQYLNSFRVTFNGYYPLAILSQFFKGQTLFVL